FFVTLYASQLNLHSFPTRRSSDLGGQPLAGTGYLGYDAAGVVDEAGEGVTGVSLGDEVFGRAQNTQAEYAVLDAWAAKPPSTDRSEEHTSELQSRGHLVCRLLLEK